MTNKEKAMKTTVLTIILILFATSLFAQQGVMFGINLNIEKKAIRWNQEVIYFYDRIGIGFHFNIDENIKYGFLCATFPLKIKEGKVSPAIKFKQQFNGAEYFCASALLKQNNFITSFDYELGIKYADNFEIGLLYHTEFTE